MSTKASTLLSIHTAEENGRRRLSPPFVAIGIYLLLLVLPKLDPCRANYAQFAEVYRGIRFSVDMVLALVDGAILLQVRGFVGGLSVVMGTVLGKIRPNWFAGIRTPWTLSSKLAWTKTHRLGGWGFMLVGILLVAAGILNSARALTVAIAVAGVGVLSMIVYSYVLWRGDPGSGPARRNPAR